MADRQVKIKDIDSNGKTNFHVMGRETCDTAGGVNTVTVTGAQIGDMVLASIEVDDTGLTVNSFTAIISAASVLTITLIGDTTARNDDCQITYEVIRA